MSGRFQGSSCGDAVGLGTRTLRRSAPSRSSPPRRASAGPAPGPASQMVAVRSPAPAPAEPPTPPRPAVQQHQARTERRIVRTAMLAHDLDPLHRSCISGSHSGCQIAASSRVSSMPCRTPGRGLRQQGASGRALTRIRHADLEQPVTLRRAGQAPVARRQPSLPQVLRIRPTSDPIHHCLRQCRRPIKSRYTPAPEPLIW